MVEPVGITLASVAFFLQVFDVCDRLYHGVKLTWRFGTDFNLTQIALEVQWARLETIVRKRRIKATEIDVDDPDHYVTSTIKRLLESMKIHFEQCNQLMAWYDGEKNHGPHNSTPYLSTHTSERDRSSSTNTSVSTSTLVTKQTPQSQENWFKRRFGKRSSASVSAAKSARGSSERLQRRGNVPILDSTEQTEVGQAVAQEARNASHEVNYFKKMSWAHRDMDTIKELISSLRDANNDLTALIESIAVDDPGRALPTFPQVEKLWPVVKKVESALYQLHLRLRGVNVSAGGVGPFHFALQLFEDYADNKMDFLKIMQEYLAPSTPLDSFVFNLQKHESTEMRERETDLLIVEVIPGQGQAQIEGNRPLTDLDCPAEPTLIGDSQIERWGYLPGNPDTHNFVYHNKAVSWTSRSTLKDTLEGSTYRSRVSPQQIVQLARLILCTHLYLERVLREHPKLRPQSYRYYEQPNENQEWDEDSPLILSPYLAVGFGSRVPPPVMGARRGIPQAPSNTMVEIGLVLYQIGIGQTINYGQGAQGFQNAKDSALHCLDKLDQRTGPIYTEVVHQFLEFNQPPQYLLSADDERQASEQIKRAISALMKLDESLVSTVTGPFRELKELHETPQTAAGLQGNPQVVVIA